LKERTEMTTIWKLLARAVHGLFVRTRAARSHDASCRNPEQETVMAAIPEEVGRESEPHEEVEPKEESPEEKERQEAEFERYCEEQRELNAIDAQICAEHGWPAEEGWPAIPPSVQLDR
jgi:hypothetical protein